MKKVCRMDKTNKRPYCLRKPCSYRLDGSCSGPVVKALWGTVVRVWTRTPYCAILEKSPAIFRVFGPPNFLKGAGLAGMGRLAPYWQRLRGAHLPTPATEIAQRQE